MFNKKSVIGIIFMSSFVSLSALTIDKSSAVVGFAGYKTSTKIKAEGTLISTLSFSRESGSATNILEGATASINVDTIDTKLALRNNNIKNLFFAHLDTKQVKGVFKNVSGNDSSGSLTLNLTFNGVTKDIPMTYKVDGGKLVVSGIMNLTHFANKAFNEFANHKTIQGLHAKKTWEEVDIYLSVNAK